MTDHLRSRIEDKQDRLDAGDFTNDRERRIARHTFEIDQDDRADQDTASDLHRPRLGTYPLDAARARDWEHIDARDVRSDGR